MKFKQFRVYFARTSVGDDGSPLANHLRNAVDEHGPNLPACDIDGGRFQMRDLTRVGRVWTGSFVKLRDDAPHVVAANDVESELPLNDGDHIIEKCHFMLRTQANVVVWQVNRSAGALARAETYLSRCLDTMVSLPQAMNDAELDRVLNGQLYEIDFAYARPTSAPNNAPRWNQDAFDMMASVDAAHAKFVLRAPRRGSLSRLARNMVRELLRAPGAEKIRVRLTDETEPVELFMAPLKDRISVMMSGRYAIAESVFQELEACFERNRHNFEPIV